MPVSKKYDELFGRFAGRIPVAYLRALAKRESNMNPSEATGPAWGLLQVTEVVRREFNRRHETRVRRKDLLDHETNVRIATSLLNRIIDGYERNHLGVPNLQPDWHNPRFVELLTFGWNAGYSEKSGVGHVVRWLSERGKADEVTIDSVHAAAKQARASRHLSNPRKVRWCKSVARLFETERGREPEDGVRIDPARLIAADLGDGERGLELVVRIPLAGAATDPGLAAHAHDLVVGWRAAATGHGGSCCCKPCRAMRAVLGPRP